MSPHLLTSVVESKWAIQPKSLAAILEIVQDHKASFDRSTFHQGEGELQSVIGTVGSRIDGTKFSTKAGSVGILHIDGPIIPRSVETMSSGPSASLQAFSKELQMMDEDPRIENIVLSFDTPGGMVTGVGEFAQFVKSLSTPVTGFVYGYAASAGYWIASATDKLYMSRTAEVGSIGTVAIFEDRTEADERRGIKRYEIVSNLSPNKRLSPQSDEGKAATIKILDKITQEFVADVASGRGVSSEDVLNRFGQGSMFIGQEAVELGMADGITTLSELVTSLNNKQTQTTAEGLMSTQAQQDATVALSAEEIKAQHPSAYEAIFNAGVSAEQDRLKSIESLKEKDASVSSFVDSKKFEAGMNKEKMALAIFEAKEEIISSAAQAIQQDGKALANALENVPTASEEPVMNGSNEEEAQRKSTVSDMVAGAKQSLKTSHNLNLEA